MWTFKRSNVRESHLSLRRLGSDRSLWIFNSLLTLFHIDGDGKTTSGHKNFNWIYDVAWSDFFFSRAFCAYTFLRNQEAFVVPGLAKSQDISSKNQSDLTMTEEKNPGLSGIFVTSKLLYCLSKVWTATKKMSSVEWPKRSSDSSCTFCSLKITTPR